MAKFKLQDYRGAMQDYTTSIQMNAANKLAFLRRGELKAVQHDNKGAIDDYTTAITLDGRLRMAFYQRGLIRIQVSAEKNNGCLDLSKAGELGLKEAYEAIKKYCN